jgi:hypothetical protein
METDKPKQLPYQDDFEFWRNMMRIMVFVLYNPVLLYFLAQDLAQDPTGVNEFLFSITDWPASRYFFFFAPMAISLRDLRLVRLEKKSGVPMPKVSRNFIYGSWLVSLVLYSLFLFALLT